MNIHCIEPLAIGEDKIDEIKRLFENKGHQFVYYNERNTDPAEIIARAKGAEVVIIANMPFPEECVYALENLKFLAVAFTGVDHVALNACKEKGIVVSNASGYSTINVAELTIGLIIDVLRNVTKLDPIVRKGGTKEGLVGFDLADKTVGIIGLGAIGQRVAKILHAFGCRILAVDRGKYPLQGVVDIDFLPLESVLKQSDIVSLHCPLNDSTRGFIGEKELAMMKNDSYLINCARGPVVDSEALVKALNEGQIAGAGIDVFDGEPPLSPELNIMKAKNTVLTPHIAFATKEAFLRRADIVSDNVISWLDGNPKNRVI